MNYKNSKEFLKSFYWLVPFLVFILGYQFCNVIFKTHILATPCLMGKTIQQALPLLVKPKLNVRLLTEKDDPSLEAGTILNQIPCPGQVIKPHQTIFVVISKLPDKIKTPQLEGLFYQEIIKLLKKQKIKFTVHFLATNQPNNLCIAQVPTAGKAVPDQGLIVYCAHQEKNLVLFPDVTHLALEDVISFLRAYQIEPTVFHTGSIKENHSCHNCIIKEQSPLAGSLVDLQKLPLVQLKV